MRLFVVVVILLSAADVAIYYHCAKNGQSETHIEQNQPISPPLPSDVHQPQAKNETASAYDAGRDCLYRLYLFTTIAGVFVAMGGIYAIYKQTEATKDSVRLQEIHLRQWVNIENWKHIPYMSEEGKLGLNIQFDVVNPTNQILTLDSVSIVFSCHGCVDQGGKVGRKNLIAPGKSHPVTILVKITEEQLTKWEDLKRLVFGVNGSVEFVGVLKDVQSQPFSGWIECSKKGGVRFVPPYGSGPYIADEGKASGDPS